MPCKYLVITPKAAQASHPNCSEESQIPCQNEQVLAFDVYFAAPPLPNGFLCCSAGFL